MAFPKPPPPPVITTHWKSSVLGFDVIDILVFPQVLFGNRRKHSEIYSPANRADIILQIAPIAKTSGLHKSFAPVIVLENNSLTNVRMRGISETHQLAIFLIGQ